MNRRNRFQSLDANREAVLTNVVLLDPATDRIVGKMEKLKAHQQGRYHAALSILLFRSDNAQLVQRRALAKYHSSGLWANACCSHPLPGENLADAAARRLYEEVGVVAPITEIGVIRYRSPVAGRDGGKLVEYEQVRLFAGRHDGPTHPNPDEVDAVKWTGRPDASDIGAKTELAPWFQLYLSLITPEIVNRNMRPIDFGFHDLGDET